MSPLPDTDPLGSTDPALPAEVARYLPEPARLGIERVYYDRIRDQALLEALGRNPQFIEDPARHMALYTDHSAVHARDVARQILRVLDLVNGLLIPARDPHRLEFMKSVGVLLAYAHDIGMVDFSRFGRDMHPEFAAQEVFRDGWDGWIEAIWQADAGGIASRLCTLAAARPGGLPQGPRIALREMLSLVLAHSKRKAPVELLNDRPGLRACVVEAVTTDLRDLHRRQAAGPGEPGDAEEAAAGEPDAGPDAGEPALPPRRPVRTAGDGPPPETARRYAEAGADVGRDAYCWLVADRGEARELADDVVDTVRALRCADALRQRGTVLRTSAGYQIMISRMTAEAVYTLRSATGETFVVEAGTKVSAEANVATSELTPEGDVRIAFHRGSFPTQEIVARAVRNAAAVVIDVEADTVESFRRPDRDQCDSPPRKRADAMRILIEGTDDNLDFAYQVRAEVERRRPRTRGRVHVAPSLASVSEMERAHYLRAREHGWSGVERQGVLKAMARWGHRVGDMDVDLAFADVRVLQLGAGEVLIEANAPSSFVYVPLGHGLCGRSLGGYPGFPTYPFVPIGDTGVIRGSVRNATITAECDVEVMIIPKETYMKHWYHTYSLDELKERLAELLEQRQE